MFRPFLKQFLVKGFVVGVGGPKVWVSDLGGTGGGRDQGFPLENGSLLRAQAGAV